MDFVNTSNLARSPGKDFSMEEIIKYENISTLAVSAAAI